METIQGKVALITGAGGAVGTHVSRVLLAEGLGCAMFYRSSRHETALAGIRDEYPDTAELVQTDLNDPQSANEAVEEVLNNYQRIDYLVNAIGGWLGGKRLHEHSPVEFEKMLSMDFRPVFNIMRAVLPVMAEQGGGRIINFSSMASLTAAPANAVYAASKAAVESLSNVAAKEYGQENIQIVTFAPDMLNTESNRQAMPDADSREWTDLEDIADAVLYVCKSGNAINGTTFRFTG